MAAWIRFMSKAPRFSSFEPDSDGSADIVGRKHAPPRIHTYTHTQQGVGIKNRPMKVTLILTVVDMQILKEHEKCMQV